MWGGIRRKSGGFSFFVTPEFLFLSFKQSAIGPCSKTLQPSPHPHVCLLKEHIHISFVLTFRSSARFLAHFVYINFPSPSSSLFLILLKYAHNGFSIRRRSGNIKRLTICSSVHFFLSFFLLQPNILLEISS